MQLATRNFVASPTDIEGITRSVLAAQSSGSEGRASYLKALIATTQLELGITPRMRKGASATLDTGQRAAHLAALEKVHLRFYATVDRTARQLFPVASAREINRRTNFARSAMSTVRAWIRVGNDITSLVPAKTTKRSLQSTGLRRQPSQIILMKRARRATKLAEAQIRALAAANPPGAEETLREFAKQIHECLVALGHKPRLRSVA